MRPCDGGKMRGGPLDGRLMAWGGPVMPMFDDTGLLIGAYFWIEDHWEYEDEQRNAENEQA